MKVKSSLAGQRNPEASETSRTSFNLTLEELSPLSTSSVKRLYHLIESRLNKEGTNLFPSYLWTHRVVSLKTKKHGKLSLSSNSKLGLLLLETLKESGTFEVITEVLSTEYALLSSCVSQSPYDISYVYAITFGSFFPSIPLYTDHPALTVPPSPIQVHNPIYQRIAPPIVSDISMLRPLPVHRLQHAPKCWFFRIHMPCNCQASEKQRTVHLSQEKEQSSNRSPFDCHSNSEVQEVILWLLNNQRTPGEPIWNI